MTFTLLFLIAKNKMIKKTTSKQKADGQKWSSHSGVESPALLIVGHFCDRLDLIIIIIIGWAQDLPWPACQRRVDGLVIGRNCDTSRSFSAYFDGPDSAF